MDDYNVKSLAPSKRRVTRIAGYADFTVSHNGHWVAGYAYSGGHAAERPSPKMGFPPRWIYCSRKN
ncbi:MAG TPA: hypothetical protein VFM96_14200 [Gaiellaceae bacterium]|nr:hypothetical protein [Gaiellaceae bacterium]